MKPSVLINLDRTRNIRLNTNALVKFEEILKKPLSEIGTAFGLKEIRAALYVGLVHEDKDLTLETVGDLIDNVGVEYVADKVGEALQLAIGKRVQDSDPN